MALLVKYGADNFQECIDAATQKSHITAFLSLCMAILNEDKEIIDILLLPDDDDAVASLPRYEEMVLQRLILQPLLQNGRVDLVVPIQVALVHNKVGMAGHILLRSTTNRETGVIDWHDMELSVVHPSWLVAPGRSNLSLIGLSYNRLRALPERIFQFRGLQKLQIHHNRIVNLPGELFTMPSISYIDASYNNIVALPEVLVQQISQSLEKLHLSRNKLTDLPSYIKHSNIRSLDISYNRFHIVPKCIPYIRRLQSLNLDNNIGIEVVPYNLGSLRNLVILSLQGLPYIRNLPSKDIMMPLDFLKSRARSMQNVTHYDVVVVTNKQYPMTQEKVCSRIVQNSKRKHHSYMHFSDAKQFLYFQSFFMLPSTTYLIVWDCQNKQPVDDLLPIINHLAVYAPDNPVLVAACWMTAITPMIEASLRDQIEGSNWRHLADRVTLLTICLEKDALVARCNTAQHLVDAVDRRGKAVAINISVPNSYFALTELLRREVHRLKDNGVSPLVNEWTLWEFVRSSPHHDLAGHKELSLVVEFLYTTSHLLCLPSNRGGEQNHYVIDRQWFMEALSGLLERHENLRDISGLYPLDFICDLMSCPTLQQTVQLPYALTLFISQQGFGIPLTNSKMLIPAMLPPYNTSVTKSADFSSQFHIRRIYTFQSTPIAFWGRLIAHLLINIEFLLSVNSKDQAGELVDQLSEDLSSLANWTYWKSGIVVWVGGSTLLFSIQAVEPITRPKYREGLEICVANTEIGTRTINAICAVVNSLLQCCYSKLWSTVSICIPCPACAQEGVTTPTMFAFEDVCSSLVEGSSLQCPSHDKLFFANDLIPDLAKPVNSHDNLFVPADSLKVRMDDKSTILSPAPCETVFRGEYGDVEVAVKVYPPPIPNPLRENTGKPLLEFWHEFSLLHHLGSGESSPNILNFLAFSVNPLALVLPFAQFCSMEEVILEGNVVLVPLLRVRMVYQLATALHFLHSMKIIHRHVCLANILVFSLSVDDPINIKLGGLSESCFALNQGIAVGKHGLFPAPEMCKSNYEYDERVDVFSFAFTSFEIITRRKLKFRKGVCFQAASDHADRPSLKLIGHVCPHYAPLLEKCWSNDPAKRPFFTAIVDFFKNPLHILTRDGHCVHDSHEVNCVAVRFTRKSGDQFSVDLYVTTSILSEKDSAILSHLSVPGLKVQESTALPSQYIICMSCTPKYLWVSFQHRYIRIYSTMSLEFVKEIPFNHHVVAMASNSNAMYLGLENGELHYYDLNQPSPLYSSTKARMVCYERPIKVLILLEDSVICASKKSMVRVHPTTLNAEQEFPVASETEIKCAVMAVDHSKDVEHLWVGFRRMQQVVVFDGLTGKPIYGFNCCEVLDKERPQVWVTCMLLVLDTVWIGLNTGTILSFSAFTYHPSLLTYFDLHDTNVRQLLLLQPSYFGPKSLLQFQSYKSQIDNPKFEHFLVDEDEEEGVISCTEYGSEGGSESDTGAVDILSSFLVSDNTSNVPPTVSVLSCGQGLKKMIPTIGSDGMVLLKSDDPKNSVQAVILEGPNSTVAKKVECQAQRPPVPYMESYATGFEESTLYEYLPQGMYGESVRVGGIDDSTSTNTGTVSSHNSLPISMVTSFEPTYSGEYNTMDIPDPALDPSLRSWEVVFKSQVPPTLPVRKPAMRRKSDGSMARRRSRKSDKVRSKEADSTPTPPRHVKGQVIDSDEDGDDPYVMMSSVRSTDIPRPSLPDRSATVSADFVRREKVVPLGLTP